MNIPRFKKALLLGMLVLLLGSIFGALPVSLRLEEDLGLSWLFLRRGPISPPSQVVVIAIDKTSSSHFQLPNLTIKWPRSLHARLLQQLKKAAPRVVVFDILFREKRDAVHDRELAGAIQASGNVILFEFLQKNLLESVDGQGRVSQMWIQNVLKPLPDFQRAAVALAPFPLPKVPVKVSQFWKFSPDGGDVPTLPAVAAQFFLLQSYDEFYALLIREKPELVSALPATAAEIISRRNLAAVMQKLHGVFETSLGLAAQMENRLADMQLSRSQKNRLRALIHLYSTGQSQFLNYYGSARSIRTIPYHKVVEADEKTLRQLDLKDKLVLIGFSELRQWEQQDGFYSVYSRADGLDISGVEIGATAAANLLHDNAVRPLAGMAYHALVIFFSLLLVVLFYFFRGLVLPVSILLLGLLYFLLATTIFSHSHLWLPITTPLMLQAPLVMLLGMSLNYLEINRERRNIRRAFGYYLPEEEVNRLARSIDHHAPGGHLMYGICLSTDAEQYTRLSEKMQPQALVEWMNQYYQAVFAPIRKHEGIISDVVGDAVMALWAGPHDAPAQRERACRAALDVLRSVQDFNRINPDQALPTRIGLHFGELVVGNVGAMDHYEYRAVGDIVNTASRIEGLNKQLGTHVLVSEAVMQGLPQLSSRYLGRFVLAGKTRAIRLYELLDSARMDTLKPVLETFSQGIKAFEHRDWKQAQEHFTIASELHETRDDASLFYLRLCREYEQTPPGESWDGAVSMQQK